MRQTLEMALEALELHGQQYPHMVKGYCLDAITAIKEALAQPEQEPLCTAAMFDDAFLAKIGLSPHTKLYTTPPERKPLTDEEIGAILEGVNAYGTRLYTFARAIEAAHGIKE